MAKYKHKNYAKRAGEIYTKGFVIPEENKIYLSPEEFTGYIKESVRRHAESPVFTAWQVEAIDNLHDYIEEKLYLTTKQKAFLDDMLSNIDQKQNDNRLWLEQYSNDKEKQEEFNNALQFFKNTLFPSKYYTWYHPRKGKREQDSNKDLMLLRVEERIKGIIKKCLEDKEPPLQLEYKNIVEKNFAGAKIKEIFETEPKFKPGELVCLRKSMTEEGANGPTNKRWLLHSISRKTIRANPVGLNSGFISSSAFPHIKEAEVPLGSIPLMVIEIDAKPIITLSKGSRIYSLRPLYDNPGENCGYFSNNQIVFMEERHLKKYRRKKQS